MFSKWNDKDISNKTLNKLAIPAIISGVIDPIITFTDQYFVGQLTAESIAGVSIATTSLFFIVWIFAFIPATASSLVAYYYGENKTTKIGVVITKSLLLAIVLGLLVASIAFMLSPYLFSLHMASEEVKKVAQEYFKIRCLGIPFMLIVYTSFGIFRGYQNTVWALKFSLVGAFVNITLDYILVNGYSNYIPSYGVAGTAWASVISLFVMSLLVIFKIAKLPGDWKLKNQSLISNRKFAGMSANMIVRLFALNLTILITQRISSNISDQHLNSLSILLNIWLFTSFFIDGYATAALALTGKLKGEKKSNLISLLLLKTLAINAVLAVLLCGISTLLIYNMSSIWSTMNDAQLISQEVILPVNLVIFFGVFAFTLDGVFIGLGKMKALRNTLIIATSAFCTPFFFFSLDWSYTLLWYMLLLWIIIRGIIPGYLFVSQYNKRTP